MWSNWSMFWNLLIFLKHKAKLMVFYILIIILQFAQTIYQDNNGVKTHYEGAKIVVTLYFF
jgi:hypothetical protein